MSVKDKLAQLEKHWDNVKRPDSVPDGSYQVKFETIILKESQQGNLGVSAKLRIIEGPSEGKVLWRWWGLGDEDAMGWLMADVQRMGLSWPKKANDLPETIGELEGRVAEVVKKQKGNYENIYIERAIDTGPEEGEEEEEEEEETESEEVETEWSKGDNVRVEFDGTYYSGVIKSVDEDEYTAEVKFEDGDMQEVEFKDLEREEGESEEGEEEEGEDEEEEEEEEEKTLRLDFDEEDIKDEEQEKIEELAASLDIDSADYDLWSDLLIELADYCNVRGNFKTPKALREAIQHALIK